MRAGARWGAGVGPDGSRGGQWKCGPDRGVVRQEWGAR